MLGEDIVEEITNLINLVYDNIATVSIGNLLKLRQKFSFKEGEEGFSPEEFCENFIQLCIDKTKEESDCFTLGRLITRTLKFQKYLKLNVRKDSMMDVYLLDLRRIMREKLD